MKHPIPIAPLMKRLQQRSESRWGAAQPFGPAGWRIDAEQHGQVTRRIIVTASEWPGWPAMPQEEWLLHASISRPDTNPTYDDLTTLHFAVWGTEGWSYQVFAPASEHVNIHAHALHLWGKLDGRALLPNFGAGGSI